MKRKEINKGDKFGRLEIIKEISPIISSNKPRRMFSCMCECGNIVETQLSLLLLGKTQSCGCYQRQRAKETQLKHGLEKHPLYSIWKNMKKRCLNPNEISYSNYGGRGILMCNQWLSDFKEFYLWSITNSYSKGLTIDRIDNDGNYCPENCRWVNRTIQNNNTRKNHYIVHEGINYTLATLSEYLKIPYNIVRYRLSTCKWTVKKLTEEYD